MYLIDLLLLLLLLLLLPGENFMRGIVPDVHPDASKVSDSGLVQYFFAGLAI